MKDGTLNMVNNANTQINSVVVPNTMMRAVANSSNSSYMPENAVDGYINTIWHSEWVPNDDPFPHIFTIELDKEITLNNISILPRQDVDAGKTTSGQIYVGDSLDNMTMVTTFIGDTSKNATVVDLKQTTAKYIQIYSLRATSANTAISDIIITTFDSDIISIFSNYYKAVDLLHKANAGSNIGEYLQTDVNDYKKEINDLYMELLSSIDYQIINKRIKTVCENFILKSKAYSKLDLFSYIESLDELNNSITLTEDKVAADTLLEKANNIYSGSNASRNEINNIVIELIDFISSIKSTDKSICNLSGIWNLSLNAYSSCMQFPDKVNLPGTLDTNKKGTYNSNDDMNKLSRYYKYTGPATYQKVIYVSPKWSNRNIVLYMERTRETRVWVNGVEVIAPNTSNILPVPQSYNISENINFGQYNTITILVDNSYPNLPVNTINASHMATDETQTNWNGILGRFELKIINKIYIDDLRIYPNSDLKTVKTEVDVKNTSTSAYSGNLTLSCPNATSIDTNINLAAGESKTFTLFDFVMPEDVQLWNEFDTTIYEMTASLDNGCIMKKNFGMRVFSKTKDADICNMKINGIKVFLRNETNCAVFPITGYAPMDVESWEKLFNTYKSYGINSVRFHSWCPPDAAFAAADKLGLYLQPELSCWDGWMFDDDVRRSYFPKEAFAIMKEYANHPSFVMFAFGNELGYNDENYQFADQLLYDLKQKDPTRLYAPGSNIGFGGFAPTANTDFFSSQFFANEELRGSYGGLREGFLNLKRPLSDINFNETVKKVFEYNVPFFSFEVGQYQVFPDVITEPQKYTGVLEPRNLKMAFEVIKQKGISETDVSAAINASGMLSRIGYKAEIEAALRTKGMSGISLLGIQDFSGQGTALVGMMNALGESKPYDFADPDEFISFFNPTVVLFESSKFCYTNKEALTGDILLSNYSQNDIQAEINYVLSYKNGTVFFEGKTGITNFKQGDLTTASIISIPLDSIKVPTQLKLEVSCLQSKNNYNIWIYPDNNPVSDGEVYVTEYLDDTAINLLKNGGKVLLSPKSLKTAFPNSLEGKFSTAFWSTQDTAQPGTMGLLLDPAHPLFKSFPTDYHSDYQWWNMTICGRPMNLENIKDKEGKEIKPLVKVLDGFKSLRNLGLIYEAAVDNGKVMVSSINLDDLIYENPEVMSFRNSIINYMNSDDFNPESEIDLTQIILGTV